MALYQNGVLVSGSGNIPELTLAQYNALSVKPTYWVRTDLDYNDLDATNVAYDNTVSGLSATKVQGAIDEVNNNLTIKRTTITATTDSDGFVNLQLPSDTQVCGVFGSNDQICLPFVYSPYWFVKVVSYTSLQAISNTSVSLQVLYQ